MAVISQFATEALVEIVEANINKCIENNHLPVGYVMDEGAEITVYGDLNPHTKITAIKVMMFGNSVLTMSYKFDGKYKMPKETKELLTRNIIMNAVTHACQEEFFYDNLSNLLCGLTTEKVLVHPIGLEIKYSSEDDSQVFMASYNGKILFAREEAINVDQGIGHNLLTTDSDFVAIITKLVAHILESTDFEFNV